jgi:hypothetical protein
MKSLFIAALLLLPMTALAGVDRDVEHLKFALLGVRSEVVACYERRLADSPDLRGTVILSFNVSKGGQVGSVRVKKNTTSSASLATCVKLAVACARTSAPLSSELMVERYLYIFTPREE